MPRGRKAVSVPIEEFIEDPTPSELDIEDFLAEWAPQTSVVEVYQRKEDGSMPHQKRVDMGILRVDLYGYLRQHFGAGKFVLQFKDANRRIVKNLTVDVGAGEVGTNGSKQIAVASDAHLQFMREQMQMQQTLLTGLIASMRGPDMGAMMTGLAAMLAALKPTASDPAAMLTAMAVTFQQLKPTEGGVKQALDLISAAKDLVPGDHNIDSWPGLIKEGITTVASVLKKPEVQPQISSHPVSVVPTIPATMQSITEPVTENSPAVDTPDMLREKWLRAQLGFLKQKALAGKDSEFWVDYILENQEEPGNQAILYALDQGATFQHLLTFDGEIGKNPVLAGWFQKFYESLSAALREDVDTTGAGGDTPDLGGNEKPRSQ